MRFRILGPLEVELDGHPIALGGDQQRALLALLLIHANERIAVDRLVAELWGEPPPARAVKRMQVAITRLRKALGADGMLRTVTGGYVLAVAPAALDAEVFAASVRDGRRALEDGRHEDADALLSDALTLWRGEPLADVAYEPFAQAEIRRLEDLRLDGVEIALQARLAAGRHREILSDVEALVGQQPLREALHHLRMLALYRCGRQAEALEAYREARSVLVDAVGVEPGPDLRRLHEAILRHDPALELRRPAELPQELEAAVTSPLVGRAHELERLLALHDDCRRRRTGALVVIAGPDGIGRTRLAAEFARAASERGDTILYTTGSSGLAVALETLRDAHAPTVLVADDLDRATAAERAALAALSLRERPVVVVATVEQAGGLEADEALALSPLGPDGVRAIAEYYAAGVRDDVPVGGLLAASGGVPQRAHAVASEWARAAAARRLEATAVRATEEREQWRAAEVQLAGNVVELQHARERAARLATPRADEARVVCPYKGLAVFDFDDSAFFFGRERTVADLVARLVGAPLLGIIGASGSGKSSLLRAGLLPALAEGTLPGSEHWRRAVIRPGEHPLQELTRATTGDAQRLVLAVDQFEETFAACADEGERQRFIEALVRIGCDGGKVVLTLRADFYERCARYDEFGRLLTANHALVGPLRRDELRRAIERPAELAGLQIEPELVDVLLRDVESEPGGLPLLSVALLELWRHRDGNRLRLGTYEHFGGVHGAVARLAEEAFGALDETEQRIARELLLRLAGTDADERVVRRRLALTEAQRVGGEAGEHVLRRLAERRLVTVSAGTVEVAHEALLREWPRLRGWLEEDADGRRMHRHLAFAAREWDGRGRDASDLFRAGRLAAALDWRTTHEDELDATERKFLDASRAQSTRAGRRVRAALVGVSLLLVVAVAAGLVARAQRRSARAEARNAEAQRLGAMAHAEPSIDRALLLAREGVALVDQPDTRGNLLETLLRSPAAIGATSDVGARITALALDAGGRRLAVGDELGSVIVLDARTRRAVARPHETGNAVVYDLRFSPDGSRLAIHTDGIVELLDARTLRSVDTMATGTLAGYRPGPPHAWALVAFSRDSRMLTTVAAAEGGRALTVRRWDARTGDLHPLDAAPGRGFTPLALLDDARLFAADARGVALLDAQSLAPLRRVDVQGERAAVSPDGRRLALGSRDGVIRVVDLRTGAVRTASGRHDGAVRALAFAPESSTLVSAGADGRLIVWDAERAARTETFTAGAEVFSLVISRDGRTAYSGDADGTVVAWDLAGDRRLVQPLGAGGAPFGTGAMAERVFARSAHRGGGVELVDTRSFAVVARLPPRPGRALVDLAVSRDGGAVATADGAGSTASQVGFEDLRAAIWDVRAGRRRAFPPGPLWPVAFARDGRHLAARGPSANAVTLWDARRRARIVTFQFHDTPVELALSPDGDRVAARGINGLVEAAAHDSPGRVHRLPLVGGHTLRFTSDGRRLLALDRSGRAWTFDTATWRTRGGPIGEGAATLDVSPRGDLVATGSRDGTTRLWDRATGRSLGALPGSANLPAAIAFVDDGTHLLAVDARGRGYRWDVRPEVWRHHACAVAGRPLTRAEWRDLFPQRAYAPACRNER